MREPWTPALAALGRGAQEDGFAPPQCVTKTSTATFPFRERAMTPAECEKIVSIIDAAADFTIATVRPDGWPQATTVSFVNDGLKLYFGTWIKSQKAQNIAACDKVAVTIDLPYKTWKDIRGLALSGHARKVDKPEELARVSELMFKKFPQLSEFVTADAPEMAIYRVDPEIVSVLDYTKGFGQTELVRV